MAAVVGVSQWCFNSLLHSTAYMNHKKGNDISIKAVTPSTEFETMYGTPYSKQKRKMPDWDNLIVRCIANDLIKERMMGNQHGLGKEPPVWQPSGYNGGWGWVGVGEMVS